MTPIPRLQQYRHCNSGTRLSPVGGGRNVCVTTDTVSINMQHGENKGLKKGICKYIWGSVKYFKVLVNSPLFFVLHIHLVTHRVSFFLFSLRARREASVKSDRLYQEVDTVLQLQTVYV
jgi:hypothetical protein